VVLAGVLVELLLQEFTEAKTKIAIAVIKILLFLILFYYD